MLKKTLQFASLLAIVSVLSGCPVYMAFEKHGGAFIAPVKGDNFVHIPDIDWDQKNNALVYFYRPDSDWGAEEIDAPSVFIDDHRYFSIRANGYSWLEMAPGIRHITMRRPIGLLLGFEGIGNFNLSKIVDADFEVEAGKIYYFRYSEIDKPSEPNPNLDEDDALAQGDMQLVTSDVAYEEIITTRFIESQAPFAKNSSAVSIAEINRLDNFKKEREELEERKEIELAQLKEAGYWRSPKWYWPFGGGPTKAVKADRDLRKLNKREDAYIASLASSEKEEKKWWWPF